MGVSLFPSTDAALLGWSLHFATTMAASPESYGVSAEAADAFVAVQAAFADAMALADAPATRTRVTVSGKNASREAMKAAARRLDYLISSADPEVTDAQRIRLGLTVTAARTTSVAPTDRPTLGLQLVHGRAVTVTLFESATGFRRLPAGVSGAILFRHVGDDVPTDFGQWQFVGLTGRTSVEVNFGDDVPPGAQVWFCAAWFSHRKELGPQSAAASIHLAGGPVVQFGAMMRRRAA